MRSATTKPTYTSRLLAGRKASTIRHKHHRMVAGSGGPLRRCCAVVVDGSLVDQRLDEAYDDDDELLELDLFDLFD